MTALTSAQRTLVAAELSGRHDVPFDTAMDMADTVATVLNPVARGEVCDECGRPSLGPLCSTHRRIEDGPYDEDFE